MTERRMFTLWCHFVLRRSPLPKRAARRALFYTMYGACVPVFNVWFWLRNPVLYVQVKRRARWISQGVGFLDA